MGPTTFLPLAWEDLQRRLRAVPTGLPAAVVGGAVALLVLVTYAWYPADPLGLLVELLLCAACGLSGRFPAPGTLAAVLLVPLLLGLPLDIPRLSLLALTIPVAVAGIDGLKALRIALSLLMLAVAGIVENTPPTPLPLFLGSMTGWVGLIAVGWILGEVTRNAAARLEEANQARALAVQTQRRSIARDLHDTVAYSTTTIILRAEQAKLRGVSDPALLADLDYIIDAGRNSMRDLRGMLEALRQLDPVVAADPDSPWRISALEEVLEARLADLRAHGFAATHLVEADLTELPEPVRDTLAKIVVEATANMVKHGDPSGPASILIDIAGGEVEAVFLNKPRPAGDGPDARLGLLGARERAEALRGEVVVTSESPTWVVEARIPLGATR